MAIELLHVDCMEYMRTLPDKAFDLAIVDPPYGIGASGMKFGNGKILKSGKRRENKVFGAKSWDDATPPAEYWAELFRVSTDQIVWGANYFIEHLRSSRGFIFWDKGPTIRGRDFADGELAWTSFDTNARRIEIAPRQPDRIHPTQKPLDLYVWLLKTYAKPGQRILDTHLGSGSSAIAADLEGFDFVGLEIDADYIAAARKRLSDYKGLFAA